MEIVIFTSDCRSGFVFEQPATLSDLIAAAGVTFNTPCSGGRCGKCAVYASGELSEPSSSELAVLGDKYYAGMRLACACKALGDCTVTIPARAETEGIVVSIAKTAVDLKFNDLALAVDIGTTTIAMQLYDADGKVVDSFPSVNPQVSYGADVLSRIEAARDPGKAADMQKKVLDLIEKGVQRFSKKIQENESIQMVIAANTTMTYLLMGWDPAELGRAPFQVSHCGAVDTQIAGISCHIIPGLSAFVGGDITAGILACQMLEQKEPMLLIDLGTNGEMALGNRQKLYACATAAGPAFEGGANRGIWGADMVKLLQKLLEEGLMDRQGLLKEPYFTKGIRIGDVLVTKEAVRAVQLAKGAIAAGIEILTESYGIRFSDISKVVLAGGFGYYLDPKAAAAIGLLPKELTDRTVTGGNTALSGAALVGNRMLTGQLRAWDDLHRRQELQIQILNLAEQVKFTETFLKKMDFC